MSHSIERLLLTVGDTTYALAPTEHVDELKRAITRCVRSGGGFLDITVDDGQRISLLITPTSAAAIAARTVHLDIDEADGQRQETWEPGAPIIFEGDAPYDTI